jgi:LysM repeat protein
MRIKKNKISIIFIVAFSLMGFVSIDTYKKNKNTNYTLDNYIESDFLNFKKNNKSLNNVNYSSYFKKNEENSLILNIEINEVNFDEMEKLKIMNPVIANYIINKKNLPTKKDLNFISRVYNIPENLLFSIMMKESRGNPYALSHKKAKGAFQFMEETAVEFNLFKNGKDLRNDPWYSADAGARYIKWLFLYVTPNKDPKVVENYNYTLAAYNAGIARVKKNSGVYIPNIKETQDYVYKIMGHVKGDKYIVKKGDNLSKIAYKMETTVEEIKKLNKNISDRRLKFGNFISIRDPNKNSDSYTVKKGDTLSKIANLTGIDLYTIKEMNRLKGDVIYVGQEIKIY